MDTGFAKVNPEKCKVIACATIMKEMRPLLPPQIRYETLEAGLHINPENLKQKLQQSIKAAESAADIIILGYGLCSLAVVGLMSKRSTIIVPRVDDCTAIFLGSRAEYARQHSHIPGTLYLSKGWLEAGAPLLQREEMVKRYGEEKAKLLIKSMFKSYTRLAFIDTGISDSEYYRTQTRTIAEELNLRYEEIKGSNSIIVRLLYGPWDEEFVTVSPGQSISFTDFRKS